MNLIPPSFSFNGNKQKAMSLKSQALTFYNYVATQADKEGLQFISRTKSLSDGSTIKITSNKLSGYDNRSGNIYIFSPYKPLKVSNGYYPYIQIKNSIDSIATHIGTLFSYDRYNPKSFSWENSEGYFKQRNKNPHSAIGGGVYNAGEYNDKELPINHIICNKYKYSDTGDLITFTGLFGPGYLNRPLVQSGWVFYNGKRFSFNCNEIFDVVVKGEVMWVLGGSNYPGGFIHLYKLSLSDLLFLNSYDESISIFDATISTSGSIEVLYLPPNSINKSSYSSSISGIYEDGRIVDAKLHPDLTEFSILFQIMDSTVDYNYTHNTLDLTCSIENGGIPNISSTLFEDEIVNIRQGIDAYDNLDGVSPTKIYDVFGIEKFINSDYTRYNVPYYSNINNPEPDYYYDEYLFIWNYVYYRRSTYSDAGYTLTYTSPNTAVKCGLTYKSGSKEYILFGIKDAIPLIFQYTKYHFSTFVGRDSSVEGTQETLPYSSDLYAVSPPGTPLTDAFPELTGVPVLPASEGSIDGESAAQAIDIRTLERFNKLELISGGEFTPKYYIGTDINNATLLGNSVQLMDFSNKNSLAEFSEYITRNGVGDIRLNIFRDFYYNYLRDNTPESTVMWVLRGASRGDRFSISANFFETNGLKRTINLHDQSGNNISVFDPDNNILVTDHYDQLVIETTENIGSADGYEIDITYPVTSSYSSVKRYIFLNGEKTLLKEVQVPFDIPLVSSIPDLTISSYKTPSIINTYPDSVKGNYTPGFVHRNFSMSYNFEAFGLGSVLETSPNTFTLGVTGFNNELLADNLDLLIITDYGAAGADFVYTNEIIPNELRKHINLIQVRSGNMQNLESEPTSILMSEIPPIPPPDPIPNNISSLDINTDAYEYKVTYCGIAG